LDCGEGKPEYVPQLEASLQNIHPKAYISDIIISHGHADHWGGLTDILSSSTLNARKSIQVHKFPLPSGCKLDHLDDFPANISVKPLLHNQVFEAEDVTLKVIYTPGHTKDHCTFWLEQEQAIFTADCVLGHGTAVFEDLSEYIEGLQHLLTYNPKQLYPGHGPVIENGFEKILDYVNHRMERENQVVELLKNKTEIGLTSMEIVEVLYKGYPENLHLPAAKGIVLHLLKLQKDGKVNTPEQHELVPENFVKILNGKWYWNKQQQDNKL
jgi:glyoxylase-like metal-dependent hydrolase (beta-lactamase superfamily II)